jgi:hypothetical protein
MTGNIPQNDRETTTSLGNIVHEFLSQHGLADTSTTSVGSKEVEDLNTGLQDFSGDGLVNEAGDRHESERA